MRVSCYKISNMNILFINTNNITIIKIHVTVLSVYHNRNFIINLILNVIKNELNEYIQICFEDEILAVLCTSVRCKSVR